MEDIRFEHMKRSPLSGFSQKIDYHALEFLRQLRDAGGNGFDGIAISWM